MVWLVVLSDTGVLPLEGVLVSVKLVLLGLMISSLEEEAVGGWREGGAGSLTSPSSEELLTFRSSETISQLMIGMSSKTAGVVCSLQFTLLSGCLSSIKQSFLLSVLSVSEFESIECSFEELMLDGALSTFFLIKWFEGCSVRIFFLMVGSGKSLLVIKVADLLATVGWLRILSVMILIRSSGVIILGLVLVAGLGFAVVLVDVGPSDFKVVAGSAGVG